MTTNFSFHCTICFEALDLFKRSPVVLPCGHTFICQQCSGRLTSCMECRYPLLMTVEETSSSSAENADIIDRPRTRHSRQNSLPHLLPSLQNQHFKHPQPAKKCIRVPIPKNFVLMSLMKSSNWTDKETSTNDQVCDDDDDDKYVKKGVESIQDSYGTYAVRERGGLLVCGKNDNKIALEEEENIQEDATDPSTDDSPTDNDDDDASLDLNDMLTEVRSVIVTQDSFDAVGHKSTEIQLLDDLSTTCIPDEKLEYGRTVQVVEFQNGVAKLARGSGIIEARPDQLVKVGDARDNACLIEGKLLSLQKRREKTKIEVNEMDCDISKLNKELSKAMTVPFRDRPHENTYSFPIDENCIYRTETSTTLSTSNSDDFSLYTSNSSSETMSSLPNAQQSVDQESVSSTQAYPQTPPRPSHRVDFRSGMSGYGLSGHRPSPRRNPRSIRRHSIY